jgi:hypothetical protein
MTQAFCINLWDGTLADRKAQLQDILTNRYAIAYAAALLLHILFLLLFTSMRGILALPASETPRPVESEPIAFEFVDSDDLPDTEQAPEATRLASTRDAVSRDEATTDLPRSDLAYSEGLVEAGRDLATLPQSRPAPGTAGSENGAEQAVESAPDEAQGEAKTDFAAVLKRPGEAAESAEQQGAFGRPVVSPSLQMKNLTSQALERGGLQLSTYDWEFGPYLAYLKRRIGSNLFPPALFRDYGLIDGQTVLRFRIYRDGALEGPNVVKYRGSPLLRETSVRAVELSAAFRPLPGDFPDKYLEITGLFDYVVIRDER